MSRQLTLAPDIFPEEIVQLIAKHGGSPSRAEKAAGVYNGAFGKIRRKEKPYGEDTKRKVLAALAGQKEETTMNKPTLLEIPDTCPPLLADLIRFKGNKSQAIKTLGTHDSTFYLVLGGKREMPPDWIVKAKVAMGLPIIGIGAAEAQQESQAPQIPPFVPWDGKAKGSIKTRPNGKAKARVIKNVPQPLVDLFEKHDGNVSAAARAIGLTGGALFQWMDGKRLFREENQRKVHAALHGMPASNDMSLGEEFDKYTLGLAICLLKGANFDRIAEIADILNGRLVFKKNTTGGWLLIYKMATEDLPKFKRLALRDANEIVCP